MGVGGDGDKTEIDQLSIVPLSSLPMSSPNKIKSQGRGGNGPSGRQAQIKLKAREGGGRGGRQVVVYREKGEITSRERDINYLTKMKMTQSRRQVRTASFLAHDTIAAP